MSDREFVAVVLAAGAGTRLGELGKRYSKPMVPVLGRPLLALGVERLRSAGARELVVVAHPENLGLLEYLSEELPEARVVLQRERRGAADAVQKAFAALPQVDEFLACACDSLFPVEDLIALTRPMPGRPRVEAGVGVLEMGLEATRTRSAVQVRDRYVVEIVEKPQQPASPLVALPVYWLPREIEPWLSNAALIGGENHVTTALAGFLASGGQVRAVPFHQRLELTSPDDLPRLEDQLRGDARLPGSGVSPSRG